MKNITKKILACTLLTLSLGCTGAYLYQSSVNTHFYQQEVVGRFVDTFYDADNTEGFNDSLKSLLSSDYLLELSDEQTLAYDTAQLSQNDADYIGYSIAKSSEEKVDGKKISVYYVNVDFMNGEELISPKKLYVELIKENSEWKIHKTIPRSV